MNETINALHALGQGLIRLAEEISNITSGAHDHKATEIQAAGSTPEQRMVKDEPQDDREVEIHTIEGIPEQEEVKKITGTKEKIHVNTAPGDEVTLDDIKVVLKKKLSEGKSSKLTGLFETFGVNYLMEMPQTEYGALLQALNEL